ncbi:MAG: WD40 repeat domain-containing protein [Planctomycetaceae bacterium]|nr:WD40 repeat domain-containing protein [Planctomycetaceae bacterium]
MWDIETGTKIDTSSHDSLPFFAPVVSAVTCIEVSDLEGSAGVVSAGRDGRIQFWSPLENAVVRVIKEPWILEGTKLNPEQRWPASPDRPYVPFESVAVSRDGKIVAAGTIDGTVHLWSAETGRYFVEFGSRTSRRRLVQISDLAEDKRGQMMIKRRFTKTAEDGVGVVAAESYEVWSIADRDEKRVSFVSFSSDGSDIETGVTGSCDVAKWRRNGNGRRSRVARMQLRRETAARSSVGRRRQDRLRPST